MSVRLREFLLLDMALLDRPHSLMLGLWLGAVSGQLLGELLLVLLSDILGVLLRYHFKSPLNLLVLLKLVYLSSLLRAARRVRSHGFGARLNLRQSLLFCG